MSRAHLVVEAEALATDHDGVLSRQQLRDLGITKSMLRAQLRARRWRTHGRRAIALHNGEPTDRGRWRIALHEVGADAALDGVTALIAAGLQGYAEPLTHVSVERGSHPRKPTSAYVHETRRRQPGDVLRAGIPRVRPAIAAVRGALWAKSDRQAALIVVMAVQQRITTATAIQNALTTVRRHKRRPFLTVIVADLVDGVQALSELDFAQLCRLRGLPKPSRQVVRRGPRGRVYLDVYWDELGVVVEIEGIHHGEGETQVNDALRQNALTLDSDAVLRIPLLGLRIAPDAFMRQVEAAVHAPRRPAA